MNISKKNHKIVLVLLVLQILVTGYLVYNYILI